MIAEKFAVVKILVFKFLTRFRILGKTFEDPCLVFNPIAESKSSFYAIQLRILVEHTKPYNSQTVVDVGEFQKVKVVLLNRAKSNP